MRREGESFSAAQCRVLELIAKGGRLPDVLDAIVPLIEAQADDMLCTILLYDDVHQTLLHGASPHLPADFVRLIDGREIGPMAGSCGARSSAARALGDRRHRHAPELGALGLLLQVRAERGAFLPKPITLGALLLKVRKLLDRK